MDLLTHSPIIINELEYVIPLGHLSPFEGSGHTIPTPHIYLNIPEGQEGLEPVFSPGHSEIVAIVKYTRGVKKQEAYQLYFMLRNGVRYGLYDLAKLDQAIIRAAGGLDNMIELPQPAGYHVKFVSIPVRTGQQVGWFDRQIFGIHMNVMDLTRPPNAFVNPNRYGLKEVYFPDDASGQDTLDGQLTLEQARRFAPDQLHQFCPLEYFIKEVKSDLESKIRVNVNSPHGPINIRDCFEHMLDVPRTAQGNWFLHESDNAFFNESTAISLVPHFSFNNLAFSVGCESGIGLSGAIYYYQSHSIPPPPYVNCPFNSITPGEFYGYEGLVDHTGRVVNGVLVIEVVKGETPVQDKLKVEYIDNTDSVSPLLPNWNFTNSAVTFHR
jgi:hypothetical protein